MALEIRVDSNLVTKLANLLSSQRNLSLSKSRHAIDKEKLLKREITPEEQTRLKEPLCSLSKPSAIKWLANSPVSDTRKQPVILFHHGYPEDYTFKSAFTLKLPLNGPQKNHDSSGELGWCNKGNLIYGINVEELGYLRKLHPTQGYDKDSDLLKFVLPAIYNATGLIPLLEETGSGFAVISPEDEGDLNALLPVDDVISSKQIAFNKMLNEFTRRAYTIEYEDKINGYPNSPKAEAMLKLASTLKVLTREFFIDYKELKDAGSKLDARYQKFISAFTAVVNSDKALDIRRGYVRPLLHLALTFAVGVGFVTALLDYGTLLATGSPLFDGVTRSRKSSAELVDAVSKDFLPIATK